MTTLREEIIKQLEPFVKPAPLEKTGIDFVTTEEMLAQRMIVTFEKLIDDYIVELQDGKEWGSAIPVLTLRALKEKLK